MNTIAIDCDGVLLDYNTAYAQAWQRAFGAGPVLVNPKAYWPMDRWGVQKLTGTALVRFRAEFDEVFWSSVPAVPNALQACELLARQGYELVCVTALDAKFATARTHNLQSLGFPIDRIITTDTIANGRSPKAEALNALRPAAFVDDYAPYLVGVDRSIHLALIMRDAEGSPNTGPLAQEPDSQHIDLGEFSRWWVNSAQQARMDGGNRPRRSTQ